MASIASSYQACADLGAHGAARSFALARHEARGSRSEDTDALAALSRMLDAGRWTSLSLAAAAAIFLAIISISA